MPSAAEAVAVVGIGYTGLPLAVALARRGQCVHGYDIDADRVRTIRSGRSPVDTVTNAELRRAGTRLRASTDPRPLAGCAVIVVCAPTPVTEVGHPDLEPLTSAIRTVRDHLRPAQLVIIESTTYPGTTDGLLLPILEESGLRAGRDFHLAYSPERLDPGNQVHTLTTIPRVVGGLTPACADRAATFFAQLTTVHRTVGLREAEAAKILENTYRQVNIALVNEFAQLCNAIGVDTWDTLAAAATKPFGFATFRPGPGVGGHCIPADPLYLVHHAATLGLPFRMAEIAHRINTGMPAWVADRACKLLDEHAISIDQARILLLGVTYKPQVADIRNTPAIPVARAFLDRGAMVDFHDPYITDLSWPGHHLWRVPALGAALRRADLTVLLQQHQHYTPAVLRATTRLFDTTGPARWSEVISL